MVGLAAALSGSPAQLSWYTAGTTLLALPSTALAAAIGLPGDGTADLAADITGDRTAEFAWSTGASAQAKALLAESPAFTGLSAEDRLGLAAVARPISLAAGSIIKLSNVDEAVVVAAGTVVMPGGEEFGRGTLIGPAVEDDQRAVAQACSAVRLFGLPVVTGLPLLLGAPLGVLTADLRGAAPGRPPVIGVHPTVGYPPLIVPPGPRPEQADDVDGGFEKRLRWVLVLVLLDPLLFTAGNVLAPILSWAEMPSDRALVHVATGSATAVVTGTAYDLTAGDDIYVGAGDQVRLAGRSQARLTYHGGASSVLCPSTTVTMGHLVSAGTPISPSAALTLEQGLVLMDTGSTSPAYTPLTSTVTVPGGEVHDAGSAWYAVSRTGVHISSGAMEFAGQRFAGDGRPVGCGDGTAVPRPSGSAPPIDPTPTSTPAPIPTVTLTPTPDPGNPPVIGPGRTTRSRATTTTTTRASVSPSNSGSPEPPENPGPVVANVRADSPEISMQGPPDQFPSQGGDVNHTVNITATASDPDGVLNMSGSYFMMADNSNGALQAQSFANNAYAGRLGPFDFTPARSGGGPISITVTAQDGVGSFGFATITVTLDACPQGT